MGKQVSVDRLDWREMFCVLHVVCEDLPHLRTLFWDQRREGFAKVGFGSVLVSVRICGCVADCGLLAGRELGDENLTAAGGIQSEFLFLSDDVTLEENKRERGRTLPPIVTVGPPPHCCTPDKPPESAGSLTLCAHVGTSECYCQAAPQL